jgi:hydroxyethylthiazole kinase
MLGKFLENVKNTRPIVHNITNYVTVNGCANILLACGSSPIMADDAEEAEEIVAISSGLNINIGTLNKNTILSMLKAGKKANELGRPVLLDPVGAGASKLRTETAFKLIDEIKFDVIRGNISEIKTLAFGVGTTRGVDADVTDMITEETLDNTVSFAKKTAEKTGCVVVITGAIDIVADREKAVCVRNGHPMMERITGAGCQLSAMTAAYIAANKENVFYAAVAAVCAMGICGEKAFLRMGKLDGNASYGNYIIDAVYNLNPDELERCAKYEMR